MYFLVAKERVFTLSSLSYCGKHNFSPNQHFSWRDADLVKKKTKKPKKTVQVCFICKKKIRCKGLCGKLCSVKSEHTKRNLPSVRKRRQQLGLFNGRDFSAPPAHGQRIEVLLVWQVWGSVNQTWTCKEICFSGGFALAVTCTTAPQVISIQEWWLE